MPDAAAAEHDDARAARDERDATAMAAPGATGIGLRAGLAMRSAASARCRPRFDNAERFRGAPVVFADPGEAGLAVARASAPPGAAILRATRPAPHGAPGRLDGGSEGPPQGEPEDEEEVPFLLALVAEAEAQNRRLGGLVFRVEEAVHRLSGRAVSDPREEAEPDAGGPVPPLFARLQEANDERSKLLAELQTLARDLDRMT